MCDLFTNEKQLMKEVLWIYGVLTKGLGKKVNGEVANKDTVLKLVLF